MKQSKPVNPRSLLSQRNADGAQGSAIAAEISGYADIGMKKEALRLTGRVLAKRRILPEEFGEAVRTIGMLSDFEKWKAQLEAAYNRQPRKFKRQTRPQMLEIYGWLGEWETALRFLSVRKSTSASEIFLGMNVLLGLDRLAEAETLANRCRRALSSPRDRFEQSLLIEALASFLAHTHRWSGAIAVWLQAPLEGPFRRNALSGIAQIYLGCAFEAAETGLRILAELKEQHESELSLCLPGNELALTLDAEKELLKLKRGIDKLLPAKERKELGMSRENS